MLETDQLTLSQSSPETLLAIIEGEDAFFQKIGRRAAKDLRSFFVSEDVSDSFMNLLQSHSGPDPWMWGFLVSHKKDQLVIGTAGFKGPPDEAGQVEVAYAIVPDYENCGHATSCLGLLVQFAFASDEVATVCAHTLPNANASTRVLDKNGFRMTGPVQDIADGPVWRWELNRPTA